MRSIGRTSVVRNVLILSAVSAATVAAPQLGCSSPGAAEPGGPASPAAEHGTGTVGMQLTLPGGDQVDSVNWTITGPNGGSTIVQSGTVDVQNSPTVSFLVGGIPAGVGYTIALSGKSTDGTATCTGSASFSVTARTTTNVSVTLQCSVGSEAGLVQVGAGTFNCATATSVTASPAETTVGDSIALSASATGPSPSALTYTWSAPSGSFDTPDAAQAGHSSARSPRRCPGCCRRSDRRHRPGRRRRPSSTRRRRRLIPSTGRPCATPGHNRTGQRRRRRCSGRHRSAEEQPCRCRVAAATGRASL